MSSACLCDNALCDGEGMCRLSLVRRVTWAAFDQRTDAGRSTVTAFLLGISAVGR